MRPASIQMRAQVGGKGMHHVDIKNAMNRIADGNTPFLHLIYIELHAPEAGKQPGVGRGRRLAR